MPSSSAEAVSSHVSFARSSLASASFVFPLLQGFVRAQAASHCRLSTSANAAPGLPPTGQAASFAGSITSGLVKHGRPSPRRARPPRSGAHRGRRSITSLAAEASPALAGRRRKGRQGTDGTRPRVKLGKIEKVQWGGGPVKSAALAGVHEAGHGRLPTMVAADARFATFSGDFSQRRNCRLLAGFRGARTDTDGLSGKAGWNHGEVPWVAGRWQGWP